MLLTHFIAQRVEIGDEIDIVYVAVLFLIAVHLYNNFRVVVIDIIRHKSEKLKFVHSILIHPQKLLLICRNFSVPINTSSNTTFFSCYDFETVIMIHIKNHINTLIYMAPAVEYELPASLDINTKHERKQHDYCIVHQGVKTGKPR